MEGKYAPVVHNVHGEYESLKKTRKEIERLLIIRGKGGLRDIGRYLKQLTPNRFTLSWCQT
jgi:hypothetical protein